jgi:hypothetical protein
MDVKMLIQAIQTTIEFEEKLEKRFPKRVHVTTYLNRKLIMKRILEMGKTSFTRLFLKFSSLI